MNSEYEELLSKRREIDRQIRKYRAKLLTVGKVKIERNQGSGNWYALKIKMVGRAVQRGIPKYITVAEKHSAKEAAEEIPALIADLQELYERIQKVESDD